MNRITVWKGSDIALRSLQEAVNHNCACDGKAPCQPHQMLLDQRVLDHFAFVNSRLALYIHAEFDPTCEWL